MIKILLLLITITLFGCSAKSAPKAEQTSGQYTTELSKTEVVLMLKIDENGGVYDASVSKSGGNKEFDKKAITIVKTWQFKPKTNKSGEAAKSTLPIVFILE